MKHVWIAVVLFSPFLSAPSRADGVSVAKIAIHAGGCEEADAGRPATLRGPEAQVQLVVTAQLPRSRVADWTGQVKYEANPAGIVNVDCLGRVTPIRDGKATVQVLGAQDSRAAVEVLVEGMSEPSAINFPNQVAPLFTKFGCDAGACHGKAGGQNGFRLSLLGFEPADDYCWVVQESLGRRIFPAAPEYSLLLQKAVGDMPHTGGKKMARDGHAYRRIVRWISQGMPYARVGDPRVTSIQVYPRRRLLDRRAQQQLKVLARYSDGTTEDVTHVARYEPNDKTMASVDESGLVRMLESTGDVAIMIRYMDFATAFEATVPLGREVTNLPPVRNFVDEHVLAKLKESGLPPSALADDATFLRRVTIDIAGRLPTPQEARLFLADGESAKRDQWIERLLASTAYADHFANKWSAVLRNRRNKDTYQGGNVAFHQWIRQSLDENKPYDQFVREILTASGEISANPAVAWWRQLTKDFEQIEDVAQLFLGLRIQCARCHHHPYEKWSQNDYYGMAAFFSRVGRKEGLAPDEPRIFHQRGTAQATNPRSGKAIKPAGLGGPVVELTADEDPRLALADWLTRKDNPFLARALVNRYWKHFFGRGIVDPEDDMRETNPPSNPRLLEALTRHFVESGYDLKALIRTICRSSTYQLSSLPNEHNAGDRSNFSRYYPKRLSAEVLLDAIDSMNGTTTKFQGLPAGLRAIEIPDHGGVDSYFLTVFGKPQAASACECERSGEASLSQSLHLLNSQEMFGKLTTGIASQLGTDRERPEDEKLEELFYRAFSHPPTPRDLRVSRDHLERGGSDRRKAYEDIVWALINTKEFLFNH